MATLLCQVHWDPKAKKVVKTYDVLEAGPKDNKIRFITRDSQPFIIQIRNEGLASWLGLKKAKNADGLKDLYQVKKAPPPKVKKTASAQVKKAGPWVKTLAPKPPLPCGTLVKGKYVPWGGAGLGPDK
jgi:hypothetical protein